MGRDHRRLSDACCGFSNVRVVDATTGELLRELTLDYQPQEHPRTARRPNP
jgi:hypothetical protein